MKVLIIQNHPIESPGVVIDIIQEKNISYDLIDLNTGQTFPELKNYQAVFVFGGPPSANDTDPKMLNQLEKIREIIALEIPFLGFCLGLQTLVKAHGGF